MATGMPPHVERRGPWHVLDLGEGSVVSGHHSRRGALLLARHEADRRGHAVYVTHDRDYRRGAWGEGERVAPGGGR